MTNYKPKLKPVNRVNTRSWIVQRLNKPQEFLNPYGNTIDFNDKDSVDRVAKVFSTDYMGAFEYEHGILGQSMSRMYDNKTTLIEYKTADFHCYIVFTTDSNWGLSEIKSQKQLVKQFIKENYFKGMNRESVAKNDYGSFYERVNGKFYNEELLGWYDLQNDFAWFIDKKMAKEFLDLF